MHMRRAINRRVLPAAGAVLALVALEVRHTQAHKGVTSPYTYNKDVYPILRERCASCHHDGGPSPMSLLRYRDDSGSGAAAWGQSIRDFLVSEQMPPWYVDPMGPAMKGGYPISPREMDKVITWAAGGTPEGDPATSVPATVPLTQWKTGPPDLKLEMPAEHTLPPGTLEDTKSFVIPTGLTEPKWVRAIDLLPGKPSMVRAAAISLQKGHVLTVWVPGNDPIAAPSGAAFKLPAGAELQLEIFYKKSYLDEQNNVADRSTIGLYFTDPPASGREIQAFNIEPADGSESRVTTAQLPSAARVIGVRPSLDQPYTSLKVDAVTPTGKRVPLLWLRAPRPEWRRRYWLAEPSELPAGTKIEVNATPYPADSDLPRSPKTYPFQVALDFVPL
jgi:hypothetical protein